MTENITNHLPAAMPNLLAGGATIGFIAFCMVVAVRGSARRLRRGNGSSAEHPARFEEAWKWATG